MKLASRLIAVSVGVGCVLNLGLGLVAAAPAHAVTIPALALSDDADLTPGQSISTTVTDVSGVLCDTSYGVGEWNVYLAWYRTGLGTPVGYSVAQSSQSGSFIAGASTTITADFYVVWLEHDQTQFDASSWNGQYTAIAGCMTAGNGVGDIADGAGANRTGTPSAPVDVTYTPVTVSRASIPQGETLDITVTDASQRWCNFTSGAGFSMGVWLTSQMAGPPDVVIPANLADRGVPGVGSFTWADRSGTATVTIPTDAYPGNYTLGLTCIGASPTYADGSRKAVFGTITVTEVQPGPGPTPGPTPPLPETGRDSGASAALAFISVGALVLGVGARVVVRHRRRAGV